MSEGVSKLAAVKDGDLLAEEEAKALWREFSEHMDAHRGDMAGFAKKKGWFSILPEYRDGKAMLIVRTTAVAKAPPAAPGPPKPKSKPSFRPRQKAGPKQQQKPKPRGGGGQTPPKKRSV